MRIDRHGRNEERLGPRWPMALREVALFAVLVAGVAAVTKYVVGSFGNESPKIEEARAMRPPHLAPRPPASDGVAIRWNGIPSLRWLVPLPRDLDAAGLQRLLDASVAWRAPLFTAAEGRGLVRNIGSSAEEGLVTWEYLDERLRCKVALVVRSGVDTSHLLLLRTTGDVLHVSSDDPRPTMLTKVEVPADIPTPADIEPKFSVHTPESGELTLWCTAKVGVDPVEAWREQLVASGWREDLTVAGLSTFSRGVRRCDLYYDADAGPDALAQLRVYGQSDPSEVGPRSES